MACMKGLVPEEPLVLDRVVVHQRERDRNADRDVDLVGREVRVMDADADLRRQGCRARRSAGARRERGERQRESGADHAMTRCVVRRRTTVPPATMAMPIRAGTSVPCRPSYRHPPRYGSTNEPASGTAR